MNSIYCLNASGMFLEASIRSESFFGGGGGRSRAAEQGFTATVLTFASNTLEITQQVLKKVKVK